LARTVERLSDMTVDCVAAFRNGEGAQLVLYLVVRGQDGELRVRRRVILTSPVCSKCANKMPFFVCAYCAHASHLTRLYYVEACLSPRQPYLVFPNNYFKYMGMPRSQLNYISKTLSLALTKVFSIRILVSIVFLSAISYRSIVILWDFFNKIYVYINNISQEYI
jgi:hypothetical protein